jgi:hypothetical protein
MTIPRYARPDDYNTEEIRRKFCAADTKGRIAILRMLYRDHTRPPYEIVRLAIEESDVEVRHWLAKHGRNLDYREIDWEKYEAQSKNEEQLRKDSFEEYRNYINTREDTYHLFPERDFTSRIENDIDPFVRAARKENPEYWDAIHWAMMEERAVETFNAASSLERLALVRNPSFDGNWILKLFDPTDRALSIDLEERQKLIIALLSNSDFVKRSRQLDMEGFSEFRSGYYDWADSADIYGNWKDLQAFFSKIWELSATWPLKSEIPGLVYSNIGALDEAKAKCNMSDLLGHNGLYPNIVLKDS